MSCLEERSAFLGMAYLAGAAAVDVLKDVPKLLVLDVLPLHACTGVTHA